MSKVDITNQVQSLSLLNPLYCLTETYDINENLAFKCYSHFLSVNYSVLNWGGVENTNAF